MEEQSKEINKKIKAIFKEIAAIRRLQAKFSNEIGGPNGILNRLTALETRLKTMHTAILVFMGLVTIAIGILAIVFSK